MTVESEVAELTTAVNNLTAAVNVKKVTLDNAVADAEQDATRAETARDVTVASEATAVNAAASANQKANEASQVVSNDAIAAIEALFNYSSVQKAIYVSNIGPWRTRGRGLSWYDTTKPSVLVGQNTAAKGQYASASAAVAAGGLVDQYFYNTTTTHWEKITATGTPASTRIYAAGQADFPADPLISSSIDAGVTRIIIHDTTVAGCPMWAEYTSGTTFLGGAASSLSIWSSLVFTGGRFIAGRVNGGSLRIFDFAAGKLFYLTTSGLSLNSKGFAEVNTAPNLVLVSSANTLPNDTVTALATYTAPDAPIDPVSGEPIAVIGGVTAGGPFTILEDGTVRKASSTSNYNSIYFDKNGYMYVTTTTAVRLYFTAESVWRTASWDVAAISPLTETTLTNAANSLISIDDKGSVISAHATGVDLVRFNPNTPAQSLIQKIGSNFNTGPYVDGAGTAAIMCDTTTGSIADTELVTDSGFDNAAQWTFFSFNDATGTITGSQLVYDAIDLGTFSSGRVKSNTSQTYTAGRTYKFVPVVASGTNSRVRLRVVDGSNTELVRISNDLLNAGAIYFQPTATVTGFIEIFFDDVRQDVSLNSISGKEVASDRSGNSNHFDVVGTLTRTAINSLTDAIAAYSGFAGGATPARLQQAYNAAWNIGTAGDFWVDGIFQFSGEVSSGSATLWQRANTALTGNFNLIRANADKKIDWRPTPGVRLSSPGAYNDGKPHTISVARIGGTAYMVIDAEVVASASNSDDLSNTTAVIAIGAQADGLNVWTGSLAEFIQSPTTTSLGAIMHRHRVMRTLIEKGNVTQPAAAVAADYITRAGQTLSATASNVYRSTRTARISTEASTVGTITAVDSGDRGEIVVGGSTGLKVSVPARNLREPSLKPVRVEMTKRYVGNSTRVDFPDPTNAAEVAAAKGMIIDTVLLNGIEIDVADGDYTKRTDSFTNFVRFTSPVATGDIVKLKGYRYDQQSS